jgi:hypothetical protein
VTHRDSGTYCDYETGADSTVVWSVTVDTPLFHVENNSGGEYRFDGYTHCPMTREQAIAYAESNTDWDSLMAAAQADATDGLAAGVCPILYTCAPVTSQDSVTDQFCDSDGVTDRELTGEGVSDGNFTYPVVSSTGGLPLEQVSCTHETEALAQEAADDQATARAETDLADQAAGLTPGACVPPSEPPVETGGETPVVDACPNLDGIQWEGYDCGTGGIIAVVEAAPVVEQPAPVTAVEAATVPAQKPAKVVLPATVPAGVVLPSSIPAGDGSSMPATSVYALAALVLGAMTLAASTVRLVKAPTR